MRRQRRRCVSELAAWIGAFERVHPARIAIDGPDAAGKSMLAEDLGDELTRRRGRDIVRVSADDFLAPDERRHAQGRLSPEGYFEDAFDYDEFCRVLAPFGPEAVGDRRTAASSWVVLVDGVFLGRPELAELWEGRVWVEASEPERLRRALERDAQRFGGDDVVRERYTRRYLPGQRLYVERCGPIESADVIVDNEDPDRPVLSWRR